MLGKVKQNKQKKVDFEPLDKIFEWKLPRIFSDKKRKIRKHK